MNHGHSDRDLSSLRSDRTRRPPAGWGDHPAHGRTLRWPGEDHGLTERESEVVSLITCGLPNLEIAKRLYLSINSIKTYIRAAYRKMGVRTRAQAVLWGVRHGFLPDGEDEMAGAPSASQPLVPAPRVESARRAAPSSTRISRRPPPGDESWDSSPARRVG